MDITVQRQIDFLHGLRRDQNAQRRDDLRCLRIKKRPYATCFDETTDIECEPTFDQGKSSSFEKPLVRRPDSAEHSGDVGHQYYCL